jgi:hypothetical protein
MFLPLDFQSKNFSYAIFIVKKRPLFVNFSIPLCGNNFLATLHNFGEYEILHTCT